MNPGWKSRFSLLKNNPLHTAALGKILHIFAAFMDLLKTVLLILQRSTFSSITAIFFKQNSLRR